MSVTKTLTLKPKPVRDVLESDDDLRYYDKKGRYILQRLKNGIWRDIPFVGSLSDVQVVGP